MESKTILITGADSGIGRATATALAEMGAHIVMMARTADRGGKARDEIAGQSRNARVDLMTCDLSDLASVRKFASEFLERYPKLDVLINNAGIYTDTRQVTADGFEWQFGVNHLGPFLLTNLLLPLLRSSSPARIINVTSGAHFGGSIHFGDLQSTHGYSGWKAYSQSKLANVLFTYELARRLTGTGITCNCLHPGFVDTRFGVNRQTGKSNWMMKLSKPFSVSPVVGAETSVYLAASPEVESVTGKYFAQRKQRSSSKASYDLASAERLWTVSAALTGM